MRSRRRRPTAPRQETGDPRAPHAVYLPDACRRLGLSVRSAERLLAEGRFPVPALPQLGVRRHRFSSADLDRYLLTASTGRR